jgi:hypothetical protein
MTAEPEAVSSYCFVTEPTTQSAMLCASLDHHYNSKGFIINRIMVTRSEHVTASSRGKTDGKSERDSLLRNRDDDTTA